MTLTAQRIESSTAIDFVFYLSTDWERSYRAKLIESIAELISPFGAKVLCVDRPVDLLTTPWRKRRKGWRWLTGAERLRRVSDNMWVWTPALLTHDMVALRLPALEAANRLLLGPALRRLLRRLGFGSERRVAWLYHPYQRGYIGLAAEGVLVYECYDDYAGAATMTAAEKRRIHKGERLLATRASVVFATSQILYEDKKRLNPNTYLSPNAVDIEHFARARQVDTPVAEPLRDVARPIIGYLGTIHEETDIPLMSYIARVRPQYTIAIIGPNQYRDAACAQTFRMLTQLPNVRWFGWLEYGELPKYLKAFDVCVIPYRVDSSFNQAVNPTKIYEYLATGKPVVTTSIPEVQTFADVVRIASTAEEFVCCIDETLAQDSPELAAARRQRAEANSWQRRAAAILEVLRDSE